MGGLVYPALSPLARKEYHRHRLFMDSLPTLLEGSKAKPAAEPGVGAKPRGQGRGQGPGGGGGSFDMFGGHGMFADLQPIGLSMALFGLLPISFRPVRVSFHPLRSTLAYCLAWLVLVLWSLHRMVTDRVRLLSEAAAAHRELSLQTQFTSVICLAFPGGLVLLPLVWVESRRLQSDVAYGTHCQNLMRSFGHIHRSCRLARGLSWVMVVFTLVVSPLVAVLWLSVVAAEGSHWTHVFVNNHVLLLLFELSAFFSSLFHCAKTFGRNLSERLSKELSLPHPCAGRLAEYRRAWLELRDVTRALVVLPFTALALLIFVLVTFTLQMYLSLVCAIEAQYALGFLIFLMALSFISQAMLVCDAVHRAVDVVSKHFLHPLEAFCGSAVSEAALEEISVFREVVSSSPLTVTAGGFWTISRETMSTILAASAGYLIILIQFRQTGNSAEAAEDFRNQSGLAETSVTQ